MTHMFITYAFSAIWAGGVTNWRNGGGPARWPQPARRATAGANPRWPERATMRTGGAREARAGRAEWSVQTDTRFVALPLKTVHDEILAQC